MVSVRSELSWVEEGELELETLRCSRANSSLKILGFESRREGIRRGERGEVEESPDRRCSRRRSAIVSFDRRNTPDGVGSDE